MQTRSMTRNATATTMFPLTGDATVDNVLMRLEAIIAKNPSRKQAIIATVLEKTGVIIKQHRGGASNEYIVTGEEMEGIINA